MWINIRTMDGKNTARIDQLSKLTKIDDLRIKVEEALGTPPKLQRLIFNGKQLEDGYTLFDYDVGLNSIIQMVVRPIEALEAKQDEASSGDESAVSTSSSTKENKSQAANVPPLPSIVVLEGSLQSEYYKAGDYVDAIDKIQGCWSEATIVKIDKKSTAESDYLYHIKFDDIHEGKVFPMQLQYIRPRASTLIPFDQVQGESVVMVNYNPLEPECKGFWFDMLVKKKNETRTRQGKKNLVGTIYIGTKRAPSQNCTITMTEQIYQIPTHRLLKERDPASETIPMRRMEKPNCTHCKDIIGRKCKYCSCHVCGGQDSPDQQIMCDECDMAYHLWCLKPPLQSVLEEDDWFCPDCRNDCSEVVHAGESLKASKKKAKMASAQGQCKRDWGKGIACVGRTKVCTIVPSDHVGPIPGIEVGMMWKYRVQVSEAGVHRPHVARIHGTEKKGAYSIVLSGGYEDDKDDGDEFIYTGSGGRDLSGNKRTAEQSCDQTLTRMNKALALNCAAAISTKGATAENWKKGRPVRVVRNCKGRKHSSYAPEEGNRYDGLYKVVKYWPEKGESGFLVWRYQLRRDDPTPAPWTKEGKKLIKEKGFEMVYPDGYVPPEETEKKKGKKRPPSENEENDGEQQPSTNKKKKKKAEGVEYKIPEKAEKNMDQDKSNQALWKECRVVASKEGGPAFIKKVEETFLCICCQEVVWQPVTTSCGHNFCHSCLQRSFQAEVFTCPTCRFQLTSKTFSVNSKLGNALEVLFPGYGSGR